MQVFRDWLLLTLYNKPHLPLEHNTIPHLSCVSSTVQDDGHHFLPSGKEGNWKVISMLCLNLKQNPLVEN